MAPPRGSPTPTPCSSAQRRGYAELAARHLEAYADHAARFWMAAGGDSKKAHALA